MITTIVSTPTRDLRDLLLEHLQEQHRALGLPVRLKPIYPDLSCEPAYKYVGGKSELLVKRPDAFPPAEHVRRYHEPFVGGGALFFRRYAGVPSVLADKNRWLVLTLKYLKTRPDAVIAALRELVEAYNSWAAEDHASAGAFYLLQRARFHAPRMEPWCRVALFLFLLQADFNGLWRVNKAGRFNVGWGKRRKLTVDVPRLLEASRALSSAVILHFDFEAAVLDGVVEGQGGCGGFAAQRGDFVYFDPVYEPVSETASFTGYSDGDWGRGGKDRDRLAAVLGKLDRRGVCWTLSDSDTPRTRALYGRWRVEVVEMARSVNSKGDKRGAVPELLVRNWR
jgi:DNA adenine methylase